MERQWFIRKLLTLLALQMAFTATMWAIVYGVQDIEDWLEDNHWVFYVSISVSLSISIGMCWFNDCIRVFPLNYIWLTILSLSKSVMVASISSFCSAESVFLVAWMMLTLFTTMAVVVMFTSKRPNILAMMAYAFLSLVVIAALFLIFFTNHFITIIVTFILLMGICAFETFDVNRIITKKEVTLDEWITGALFLYMDLTLILIFISCWPPRNMKSK